MATKPESGLTPNLRIAKFIGSLPASTTEVISITILQALAADQIMACNSGKDRLALAKQLTHADNDEGDPLRAVIFCALIDYAFARPRIPQHVFDRLADESGDPQLKQAALRVPLAQRQFQQAAAAWKQLRARI